MNNIIECSITSDFDGKILSFDKNAEKLFGFSNHDVINLKRIYNLLHPDYVINFVNKFNLFIENNIYFSEYMAVFLCKDDTSFTGLLKFNKNGTILNISITNNIDKLANSIGISTLLNKLSVIFRLKFVIGTIIPYIFAIFWSFSRYDNISYLILIVLFVALLLCHIAANTFNDYFDWKSGRDQINIDYILFSTGGSRAIEFKFISEKMLLYISIICTLIAFLIGVYLFYIRGVCILILGSVAFFSMYFYSAPPIHLASRYGLGEIMHIICLGPLIIYGSVYSLCGYAHYIDFFVGLPFGLLITTSLLINEYPDSKYDKISNKINLAVLLGYKYIPYMIMFLLFLVFSIIVYGVFNLLFPIYFLFVFLTCPYMYILIKTVFNIQNGRIFLFESCTKIFNLYIYISFILILSICLNIFYPW